MVQVETSERGAASGSSDGASASAPDGALKRSVGRPVAAVSRFRDRVRSTSTGRVFWRVVVTVVGVAVVVGGIILLPLPGPGWLIIFAGLGILATEYEWASRLLRYAREQVSKWTSWVGRQPRWIQGIVGVLGAAFLVAVFVVVYLVLYA